jgi:hypothetical protein
MTYNQLTTEEFIRRAKEVHGDKYDYSKVEYVNIKTKVCIICKKHGEFWQEAGSHLNGSGCPNCRMEKHWTTRGKKTTEEFIVEAKAIHGDKYDYSKVEYVNPNTKVCIVCPKHGEFNCTPTNHLRGKGCPVCGHEKAAKKKIKLTTEEFIRRAKEVHGDKYDYSKVVFTKMGDKVCIVCPEHGEFWQTPTCHLNGQGCPKCGGRYKFTTKEFIEKAKAVHDDKYDYSKVEYVNCNTKVCIICPEHGEFWQKPSNHLSGQGCPKCVGNEQSTTEDFIRRAKAVHGDKYDYSKVEYVNCNAKVCIICPEHGEFWMTPKNHLYGKGCACCNRGLTKQYKFNLLQEFKNEYEFRAFLENNDENILYVILRNIEPKYEPIKKDIEKALDRSFNENPIKALEEKYSSDSDDEEGDDETWAESETPETPAKTEEEPIIDLDDDEAVDAILSSGSDTEFERTEPTIEDVIKNTEQEIKVINKIEHLLTPEDRKYIMDKFLNDKRRAWMLKREEGVK